MNKSTSNLGRPKKDPADRRTEPIMIWLTRKEKDDLTAAMKLREGPGSMSSFVAALVKTELKRRGITVGNP